MNRRRAEPVLRTPSPPTSTSRRLIPATILLSLSAIAAAAAVATWVVAPEPSLSSYSLAIAAEFGGEDLVVVGSTNLPEGARVDLYAWSDIEPLSEALTWSGLVDVAHGSFGVRIPTASWPNGLVHVTASFSVDGAVGQPLDVAGQVGLHGEGLVGSMVLVDEYGVRYLTAKADAIKR